MEIRWGKNANIMHTLLKGSKRFIGILKQHCTWIGLTKKLRQRIHGCFERNGIFACK